MERRDRVDIIAEILRIARNGARKTHIVYKANLNHTILRQYLDSLEEQGLIKKDIEPGNGVKTTEKGLEFIEKYHDLSQLASF